MTIRLF